MRLFLAGAVLCATTALAQYEHDEDNELEARDVRNSVWKAAHGGDRPSYHGFEEMAEHYPGHPVKAFGAKHHARDVEDEAGLGDEEGFIDSAASFANNIARAIKSAKDHVGKKAKESVKHAKAKAGHEAVDEDDHEDEDRPFQWGPPGVRKHHGAGEWAKDGEFPDFGFATKHHARDVEEEGDDAEVDYDGDSSVFRRDAGAEEFEDDIDWDPSTRYDDDYEGSPLAERGLGDVEEDEPAATAFDDEEEFVDPKLELEQEFDDGVEERDEEGLFERDAEPEPEPFNFFGWGGKKDAHKGDNHDEQEAWKKGMKHVFARDGGLDPEEEDDDVEGAYDPIAEDPSLTDDEFYAALAGDGDLDDDQTLERRSMPHIIDGVYEDE